MEPEVVVIIGRFRSEAGLRGVGGEADARDWARSYIVPFCLLESRVCGVGCGSLLRSGSRKDVVEEAELGNGPPSGPIRLLPVPLLLDDTPPTLAASLLSLAAMTSSWYILCFLSS